MSEIKPSEQTIINTLNSELQRANDNRIYLMALLQEIQQENAQLRAQLTEFENNTAEPVE